MTNTTTVRALSTLRSVELTQDMETKYLRKLASVATEVEFSANKLIYQRGDKGQAVYLVQQGRVAIEIDVPGQGLITMHTVEPGHFFGWSSLFPSERKMAWTRTIEPTRVFRFDAERLRAICQTDHEFEFAIARRAARVTSERLKSTRQQLTDLVAQS